MKVLVSSSDKINVTNSELVPFLTFVQPDKRPTLPELLTFPAEKGNISIPERIGTNYTAFGILLLEDDTGTIVDGIVHEYQRDTHNINIAILKRWLKGRGRQPGTWRTLVNVLRDTMLTELADDIDASLS